MFPRTVETGVFQGWGIIATAVFLALLWFGRIVAVEGQPIAGSGSWDPGNKLPTLPNTTFNVMLPILGGSVIGRVKAIDPENTTLRYQIASVSERKYGTAYTSANRSTFDDDCQNSTYETFPRNLFCMNPNGSLILLTDNNNINSAGAGDLFMIEIRITDSGFPQRQMTGNITVTLSDDCSPASDIFRSISTNQGCKPWLYTFLSMKNQPNTSIDIDLIGTRVGRLTQIEINVTDIRSQVYALGTATVIVTIARNADPTNFAVVTLAVNSSLDIAITPIKLYVRSYVALETVRVTMNARGADGVLSSPLTVSPSAVKLRGVRIWSECHRTSCVSEYKRGIEALTTLDSDCGKRNEAKIVRARYEDCFRPPIILKNPYLVIEVAPIWNYRYMQCEYHSNSYSTVQWFRDGEPASCSYVSHMRLRRETKPVLTLFASICSYWSYDALQQGNYQCQVTTPYAGSVMSEAGLFQMQDVSTTRMQINMTKIVFTATMANETSPEFIMVNQTVQDWFADLLLNSTIKNYTSQLVINRIKRGSVIVELFVYFSHIQDADRIAICESIVHFNNSSDGIEDIKIYNLDCCPQQQTGRAHNQGEMLWNTTLAGRVATMPCPYGGGTANRTCHPNFVTGPVWDSPLLGLCLFRSNLTNNLHALSQTNVSAANANATAKELVNLKSDSTSFTSEFDFEFSAVTMWNIIEADNSSEEVGNLLLQTVNNLLLTETALVARAQREYKSTTRILKTLETIANTKQVSSAASPGEVELPNIALKVMEIPFNSSYQRSGLTLLSPQSNTTGTNIGIFSILGNPVQKSSESETTIFLPASVFGRVNNLSSHNVRITSFVFINGKFFIPDAKLDDIANSEGNTFERVLGSRVMSAAFPGIKIDNLTDPVESYFTSTSSNLSSHPATCVFWEFGSEDDARSMWSSKGCRMKNRNNGRFVCECDHLTHFAVLLDVNDPGKPTKSLALDIVTYIGCGISMAGLLLTLLTFAIFPNLRQKLPPRILMCLCVSILAVLIIFVVGIDRTSPRTGCQVVGLLLHYFVLATFCWMAVEGYNLYRSFVKVVGVHTHFFLLKASIFAWGVPVVAVGVTAWLRWDDYGNNNNCMLHGDTFYFAFLTPILAVIALNFIVLFFVMTGIRKGTKLSKDGKTNSRAQIRIAFACSVLLGLTWASAIFAVGNLKFTFQLVFCVLNSLQGFFIFLFYCVRNPDVRKEWRRALGMKSADRGIQGTSALTRKRNKTNSTNRSNSATKIVHGQSRSEDEKRRRYRSDQELEIKAGIRRWNPSNPYPSSDTAMSNQITVT